MSVCLPVMLQKALLLMDVFILVYVQNLTEPENGEMQMTTLRIGGEARFTCNHGYSLVGSDQVGLKQHGLHRVDLHCKPELDL